MDASTSNSILGSVKKALGIDPSITSFDLDLLMHINTVFDAMNQIGIWIDRTNPVDEDSTWSDLVTGSLTATVKTYVVLRVRLLFDPPTSGTVMEAINAQIKELEWRLYTAYFTDAYADSDDEEDEDDE